MTTDASATTAGETVTAIVAGGTTIVLPPGTTMIIQANATAAAENNATSNATAASNATNAVTVENETENNNGTDIVTTVDADLEVSTIGGADNDTDAFTSAKPGNGHGADEEGASDRKSTRLNSSHSTLSRMPSSA